MASSNRHWPTMFKSKPNNDVDSSRMPSGCNRNPYLPVSGGEERSPEPKSRWNPRPEQIRILETIFNSGMVNPPRDEIRKIRTRLQEYGQVGDANVFYWFQNRKSRSKHKQRQLQTNKTQTPSSAIFTAPASSSSSSSSDKSSLVNPIGSIDLLNSPSATVNQLPLYQASSSEFLSEPYFFDPGQGSGLTQGFCFNDSSCIADQSAGNFPRGLLGELAKKAEYEKMKLQQQQQQQHDQQFSYNAVASAQNIADPVVPPTLPFPFPNNQIFQGLAESAPTKSTVYINDVCFEVAFEPFNVREAFGDDAVLVQLSGQPVPTDEWGITQQPLQHGAFYYLLRPFPPSRDH